MSRKVMSNPTMMHSEKPLRLSARKLAFTSKLAVLAGVLNAVAVLPAQAQLPAPATGAPQSSVETPRKPTSSVPYLPPAASDDDIVGFQSDGPPEIEVKPKPSSTPDAPPKPQPAKPQPAKPESGKPDPGKPQPLSVGGVSIRGLSDVAVIKKLRAEHESKLRANVELWDGQRAHRFRRSSLGAKIPYYKLLADARKISKSGGDVPLRFEVDLKVATKAIQTLAGRINHSPAAASLDIDDAGKVIFTGGEGATLAIDGSAMRVQAALESTPPKGYVELVIARQSGTNNLRQFKSLLAEYSTPYDSKIQGRTTNLKMSAKLINGEIVKPGKTFSTNLAIGPRNAANGWKEAKMFMNGEVVDGVGAGICQAATTLYNAALLSNLPIVERHQHSFRVSYAPASRDATIYWGQKDMKFRNNTSGPIYVQTMVKGERFHVRLYGIAPVKANVAIESKVLSQKNGVRSEAYRVVQTSSGQKRELLSRDYYKPKAH